MLERIDGFHSASQYIAPQETRSDDSLSRLVNLVSSKYNELRLERWSSHENPEVAKVSELAAGHFDGKKLF